MIQRKTRTKIIATVGPAVADRNVLTRLVLAGVDIFRLNFSHGDRAEKKEWIAKIRGIEQELDEPVAILADLRGPKIRTGIIEKGAMNLEEGVTVILTARDVLGGKNTIPIDYKNLPREVSAGDRILLSDGLIELVVERVDGSDILCVVVHGGTLENRKGVNLPGVPISAPSLTEKDKGDLGFALENQVDFIALSFVRSAGDVLELKRIIEGAGAAGAKVLAKIERPEAVEDFPAILEAADGIMIARGDLGVEMGPERIPLIQKNFIALSNRAGKPVITATQMLETMIRYPTPTRAETSDIANAVLDGTDAVMLSGETAVGMYPERVIDVITRVAREIEGKGESRRGAFMDDDVKSLPDAIGRAACRLARDMKAAAIIAFSQRGTTAALVAKNRPPSAVYAVTPSRMVQRHLTLYSGIRPLFAPRLATTEEQITVVEEVILSKGYLDRGDLVIIVMSSPVSIPGSTNLIKAHRLGIKGFVEAY